MSHFSQVKTQIRTLEPLQKALTDLGLSWKPAASAKSDRGQTVTAEVVIPQENGYDIGFKWNGQEYELVADMHYWQQPWTVESFLNKVSQRYAVQTVMTESAHKGFALTEQQQQQDGSIRLVLQRWHG
ncbi:Protein of unknown function (DUF1257) [Synechococcus sp. PCC 7502]|uniref:DUF1257 domain-containing protein n=1 Tax=Synechococcus sp. PCC 7502 TaxID=1173263 RepID=UPI00029FD4A0|nr:DUF1257 domain-containing protein [Synechococcus sp. PCC 7502]AFY72321.1 Protein of unknown function (DUF1257) [Synechococcus sp. PCC 7502]